MLFNRHLNVKEQNNIYFKTKWLHLFNRAFYSYGWKQAGWRWPCFDTNLPALLCKSSSSYANQSFSRTISITKQRRFASKQGYSQLHMHSQAWDHACKMVYMCYLDWEKKRNRKKEKGHLFNITWCRYTADHTACLWNQNGCDSCPKIPWQQVSDVLQ